MNFKKFISGVSAFAIAATAFAGMAVTASAAGYTRTLTDSFALKGYVANTLYNFQTNTPEVLPTEGDLRYREGNVWGLHNFGSGNRSATATIHVDKGDILVIQEYNADYVTTINRGAENSTLTSSTGYRVFDITADAEDVTFTVPRYGGIVAALVMDVDPDAPAETLTVNYKFGDEIVFSDTSIDIAGKHVGDTMTVPFRAYVEKDGVIYSTTKNGSNPHYGDSVTLSSDTVVTKAVSKVDIEGTVELFEDLDGSTANNADIRASYMSAYDNKSYTSAADLPAGVYTFIISGMNKGRGSSVAVGDTTVVGAADIANKNAWGTATITDVTVSEAGKLTLVAGESKTIDDYDVIIAIKTGDITPDQTTKDATYTFDVEDWNNMTLHVVATNGTDTKEGSMALANTTFVADGDVALAVQITDIPENVTITRIYID
jgi:hypothetical protein